MGFWGQNGSDHNFSIPLSIRYGLKNHVLGHTAIPRKIGDIPFMYRVFSLVLYHFFNPYTFGG